MSEEIKKKLRIARKKWIFSLETKQKISESQKGKIISEECRRKISEANKGCIAWNKGLKGTQKSNSGSFGVGHIPWHKGKDYSGMTGKHHSEETIKKMSKTKKGKVFSEEHKRKLGNSKRGIKLTSEHIRKVLRRRIPTSLEIKFQEIINKNGLPYKFVGDGSFMIGRKNPDFININNKKIAIEVYARFHKLKHAETIEQWKEDRKEFFAEYGWELMFFDETEVNENHILKRLEVCH